MCVCARECVSVCVCARVCYGYLWDKAYFLLLSSNHTQFGGGVEEEKKSLSTTAKIKSNAFDCECVCGAGDMNCWWWFRWGGGCQFLNGALSITLCTLNVLWF